MKKLVVLMMMVATLLVAATGFAAPTANSNITAAKAYVPQNAILQGYDADEKEVEIKFFDNDTFLRYEVELALPSQEVKEVSIKGATTAKSPSVVKTEAEIKDIILEAYPTAKDIVVKLEKEDRYYEYEAKFTTPEYRAEVEINPVTGAFTERTHKYL